MEGRPRHDGIGDAHGASIANDEMEGTNSMPLRTKLTEKLGISHPILLAPMGTASGGTLAKAVTEAGGLGIIGFGCGNQERIDQEFRAAGNARVGCGFITWSLARQPHLLARALDHKPAAVMCFTAGAFGFFILSNPAIGRCNRRSPCACFVASGRGPRRRVMAPTCNRPLG